MSAGRGARRHQREAVPQIGADGGGDDARGPGQPGERRVVLAVSDEQRPLLPALDARPHLFELLLRAAGERDPHVVARGPREISSHQPADETRCAEHHDVVFAFRDVHIGAT